MPCSISMSSLLVQRVLRCKSLMKATQQIVFLHLRFFLWLQLPFSLCLVLHIRNQPESGLADEFITKIFSPLLKVFQPKHALHTTHKKTQFNYEKFEKFFSFKFQFYLCWVRSSGRTNCKCPACKAALVRSNKKVITLALSFGAGPSISGMYDLLDKRAHPIVKCFNMDVWLHGRTSSSSNVILIN